MGARDPAANLQIARILARRKSGKTAYVQRLFNQIWSANAGVIPFYLDIGVQDDKPLNLIDVRECAKLQRPDSKGNELDLLAHSSDKRLVTVEVRKGQEKLALSGVEGSNLRSVG